MKTLICQIKTTAERLDGMSYIIRAADGSVIVVDGAMYDEDPELLLEQLVKITGSDKPTIDYWFITHNHMDHTFCFMACAEKYADKLTVKKMVYSFFPEEIYAAMEPACVLELHRFEAAVDIFGAERVTPVAGDVMELGGTRIEFLYTSADCPITNGGKGMTVNDSSLVFRVTAEGQTVLFLGDIEKLGDSVMIEKYGASLKSDVCQVAHHGWTASTIEFYEIVDPDILLWPVKTPNLEWMLLSSDVDRHIAGKMRVRDIYVAGNGTVWLEMPIKPRTEPFLPELSDPEPRTGKVDLVIPRAASAPALDPSDPRWSDAEELDLKYVLYNDPPGYVSKGQGSDKARAAVLWHGDSLYMRFTVDKKTFSDPDRRSSIDSDCFRVYVCEDVVDEPWTVWQKGEGDPAWVPNLKLYYEPKNIDGEKLLTTCPQRCDCVPFVREDGYEIFARFRFARHHESGESVMLSFECNGVREKGNKRDYCLSFVPGKIPHCFISPYSLAMAKLG